MKPRYTIGDFEPSESSGESLESTVLSQICSRAEFGAIAFYAASRQPHWLVTTGYCQTTGHDEVFAPLFWLNRFYYYDDKHRVMRIQYEPVVGSFGAGVLPQIPQNARYEFSFHESEALRAVFTVALTVLKLGLNTAIPIHQTEWWKTDVGVQEHWGQSNPVLDAQGKLKTYAWSAKGDAAMKNGEKD